MNNEIFEALTDVQLLTLVLYGEARGEGLDGMLGVGSVVRNRVSEGKYGTGYAGVILRNKQFSCFNEGDSNRDLLTICALDFHKAKESGKAFKACHWIAKGIFENELATNVGIANHYYASGIEPPYWIENMQLMRVIKNHKFYHG